MSGLDFNLRALNILVGLLRGDNDLPLDLVNLGYACVGIEPKFDNGRGGYVNPELLAASSLLGHAIAFEWKSGGNINHDQARRYGDISTQALVSNAGLRPVEARTHDVAYLVPDPVRDKAARALTSNGYDFVLLAADDLLIELAQGAFEVEETTEAFRRGIAVDWSTAPVGYVPCWTNSGDRMFAEMLLPVALEHMSRNERHVTRGALCRGIFPATWDSFSSELRGELQRRVQAVLRDGCRQELVEFLGEERRDTGVRFVFPLNPFQLRGRERADALRRLAKAQARFLTRLRQKEAATRQLRLDLGDD